MAATSAITDTALRGLVLQAFYERRQSRDFLVPTAGWIDEKADSDELCRISEQLGEHGLIEWEPTYEGGAGRITALGVDVVEGQRQPGIAVQLVHNHYATTISGSTNVIVGNNNTQQVNAAFEELLRAIDAYSGSDAEKEKSKGLLAQLASSPVFAQVVGQLTRFGLEHLV